MAIIGYGEDGLTYLGLTTQLSAILKQSEDNTSPKDCTVFFQPSFGRGKWYGEFDAILATKKAVYLMESKWDNVSDTQRRPVLLDAVQIRRHAMFAWLLERWRRVTHSRAWPADWPENWRAFHANAHHDFTQEFHDHRLPGVHTRLAKNQAYILPALIKYPEVVRNILLYFHRENIKPPDGVVNKHGQPLADPVFELIPLPYRALGNSGYFEMVD